MRSRNHEHFLPRRQSWTQNLHRLCEQPEEPEYMSRCVPVGTAMWPVHGDVGA